MKCFLLHIFLVFPIYFGNANNETNSDETNVISYKTNLCGRQRQLQGQKVLVENSLKGMNITASLAGDGETDKIWKIMMDEVARQAGFNITYNATGGVGFFKNYDEKLYYETGVYDVAVDWFTRRPDRLNTGILFPEAWWDADTIMVVNMKEERKRNLMAFLEPFTNGLWFLIFMVTILTGLMYFILDYLRSKRHDNKELDADLKKSLFMSMNAFVGHSEFDPKATSTRLLTFSMNFLYLVILSAYTANLASVLVAKNSSTVEINDFKDVLRARQNICVQRGLAYVDSVIQKYPDSKTLMKEYETAEEMFQGLGNGDCLVLLTSVEDWKSKQRQRTFNKDCGMIWVGRRVEPVIASFALRASADLCTGLLNDVLDYYLIKMKADGVMDKIWFNYRNTNLNNTCSVSDNTYTDNNELNLSVPDMAGIFMIHLACMCLAFFGECFLFCACVSDKQKIIKDDSRKTLGRSTRELGKFLSKKDISEELRKSETSIANEATAFEEKRKISTSKKYSSYVGLPFVIENLESIVDHLKELKNLKNQSHYMRNSDMIIVKNNRD